MTKIKLIGDYSRTYTVDTHPEVLELLEQGWDIVSYHESEAHLGYRWRALLKYVEIMTGTIMESMPTVKLTEAKLKKRK